MPGSANMSRQRTTNMESILITALAAVILSRELREWYRLLVIGVEGENKPPSWADTILTHRFLYLSYI